MFKLFLSMSVVYLAPLLRFNYTYANLYHQYVWFAVNVLPIRFPDWDRMLSQNFILVEDPLSLDRIRSVLTRLEDTIIFSLIERAQFAHNPRIYQRGTFKELKDLGFDGSWMEWFLKETETFHGTFNLFKSSSKRTSIILFTQLKHVGIQGGFVFTKQHVQPESVNPQPR